MRISVFSFVIPCGSEEAVFSICFLWLWHRLLFDPEGGDNVPSKSGAFSKAQSVTAHKTVVSIVTAVRIIDPAPSVEAFLNGVYQVSHPSIYLSIYLSVCLSMAV
jgi:hypothetical protein